MRGTNKSWFAKGMRDAIPIALGYLAVSFTLGIAAKNAGFTPFQAFLVSFTNNASAGEFAGFTLIAAGGGYLEVAILILITNARYLLMSCASSQKLPPDTPMIQRLLLSYDVTDELSILFFWCIYCSTSRLGFRNTFWNFDGIHSTS